ncbi:UPF0171-domain-containing protein [Hyphopichia burtonii NRRL Y-1933]|uniref:Nitrogen permease regulator 3 n=1 Tax=Hyphopichia burtonii NRRL Y-1933 TaxID=984485 RepID=A0A1E4RPW2_9ASCO|nr:UPF0171-domain-containing protein [Hyphopichia burtonii NRRL Y-1933]ODV69312.1 UPF0171-domain-containing protein [Hyphopichia burtonii NRRL Y-1933]
MSFNLPNPSLLGILFVISTHSGPQLVFKYPPDLSNERIQKRIRRKKVKSASFGRNSNTDIDDTSSSDDDGDAEDDYEVVDSDEDSNVQEFETENEWDSSHLDFYMGTKKDIFSFLDEQERQRKLKLKKSENELNFKEKPHNSIDAIKISDNDFSSNLLGFEPDYLSEILTPPKQMCNSRFEIMIENSIFLGLPIHNYDDGSWRITKKKHSKSNKNADEEDNVNNNENIKHSMNMFHVVFIMNPPIIECNYRIDEMFHYVISRLSLVLRYEQLKHDYVWNQVKLISKLKNEWKPSSNISLNNYLIMKSSLAKLIAECYTSISSSKIANLSINNKLRSFQIPIKTEFHSLPDSTVPFLPGSHLSSTVNMLGNTGLINVGETTRYGMNDNEDSDEIANAEDIIYFALLLLDDPETIIKDIRGELHSTLANFIRMIKPTESLLKLSNKLQQSDNSISVDINQIKSFAFHLIYWRRARVIAPLSTRSVYIVSPMAPITINLHEDIPKFKDSFQTLPSLPHFLKSLSTRSRKPKQFATIIPSKDHRDIYLNALAWLIRFGYVTQLHTFIWLKISRKVKLKVEEDLEYESSKIAKRKRDSDATDKLTSNVRSSGTTDNTSKQIDEGLSDIRNYKANNVSTSSYDPDLELLDKNIKSLNLGPNIVLEDDEDTIVIDPGRATTLERRWINKIIEDECKLSPELTGVFFKLLKYMNGKNSLELLLLKENITRHDLRKLLFAIEDHIISVRHW